MRHIPLLAVFILSLLPIPCVASASDDLSRWKLGLEGGKLIAHSTSPDGKWALFEINAFDMGMPTTATAIAVADLHRSSLIGLLDCETQWSTDLPYQAYLTVLWSPNGSYLAIHDSTPKNSLLKLYRVTVTDLKSVVLPDLRQLAATQLHISTKNIKSSGQLPIKWTATDDLTVQVKLSTNDLLKQKEFTLHILPDGLVQVSQ